ncbi:MAG: AgmX/PglI C-terminal domain-containing protein [Archangium sp.]
MHFIEMMREGGPLAMVAVALGFLGVILGGIALVLGLGGSRAGFGLGIATLILATLASAAGIGGTLIGKKQVENALLFVDNDVDKSRILKMGHKEASGAATLGAFAALLPLLLGAVGALSGGRAPGPSSRRQGIDLAAGPQPETSGRAVLAVVFIGIAALAASGAWVTGHRPPPTAKYDFDEADTQSWELASAVNEAELATQPFDAHPKPKLSDELPDRFATTTGLNREEEYWARIDRACVRLERALDPYWASSDHHAWPHTLQNVPASVAWKPAANACIKAQLEPVKGRGLVTRSVMTPDAMLTSSLLQDDELRQRIIVKRDTMVDEPPAEDEPTVGTASLDRESIQRTVRGAVRNVQNCFERALVKNPKLEGKLEIEMIIGATGKVTKASEVDTSFPDAAVTSCVVKEIEKLKFPAPVGGGIVTVRYPFVFKAAQ